MTKMAQPKEMTRYSKEWFEALLNLEYKNDIPKETKQYYKPISLSFGKVQRDPANERILILKNKFQLADLFVIIIYLFVKDLLPLLIQLFWIVGGSIHYLLL